MDIPDRSIWEVKDIDTADPKMLGWVTAFCIEPWRRQQGIHWSKDEY